MKKLFLLKIGGSVATYKNNPDHSIRKDTLSEVFKIINSLRKKGHLQFIIVHGAGGHIHHLAHTYDLKGGTLGNPAKEAGAVHTQDAVTQLHSEIIELGSHSGLPLQSFPTHSVITQHDKRINTCSIVNIQKALSTNQIPVLHGDMVDDDTLGMSICSGDAVVAHLTTLLPVTHLFFATDVDGIYTSDPHTDPEAQLIQELTFEEMKKTIKLSESHNTDTTGGLQGKMKECSDLFKISPTLKEIGIFNGLQTNNYRKVFLNEQLPHTRILK